MLMEQDATSDFSLWPVQLLVFTSKEIRKEFKKFTWEKKNQVIVGSSCNVTLYDPNSATEPQ